MNQLLGQCRPSSELGFTSKQGQYLAFIYAYTQVLGRPPAEADLQRQFHVSPPSVHQMILTLERAGLIRRQPGGARSIEVLVDPAALPTLRADNEQPVKSSVQRYLAPPLFGGTREETDPRRLRLSWLPNSKMPSRQQKQRATNRFSSTRHHIPPRR